MTQPSQSHFFAFLSRLKLINRWPLMRNVNTENVCEHSLQVAFVAHALAAIENEYFEGQLDPADIALKAMFHDVSEVITGDLPTPVKYSNPHIAHEYKKIEHAASQQLLSTIPDALQAIYQPLFDEHLWPEAAQRIVKDADTLCAYMKCLEELAAGNHEFHLAKSRLETGHPRSNESHNGLFYKDLLSKFRINTR